MRANYQHVKELRKIIKAKKEYRVLLERFNRKQLLEFLDNGVINRNNLIDEISKLNTTPLAEYWGNRLNKADLDKSNPILRQQAYSLLDRQIRTTSTVEADRIISNAAYIQDLHQQLEVEKEKLRKIIRNAEDIQHELQTIKQEARQNATKPEIMDAYQSGGRVKYVTDGFVSEDGILKRIEVPKQVTYRNLDGFAKDIENYNLNTSEYDQVLLENKQSQLMGEGDVYGSKTWIWSQAEKTRHSMMDNQTVNVTDFFTVTNEVTGEVDEGLYPCDFRMSPGNTVNCLCSVVYNQI